MLRQKSTDLVQGILCCGELVQQLIVVRLQLIQHLGAIFHSLTQNLIFKRTFLVSCFPSLSWKTRASRSSGQTSTSSPPSDVLNRGLKIDVLAVSSPLLLSNKWSRLPNASEMLDFESWRGCCKLSNDGRRRFVSDFDLLDTPSPNMDCCLIVCSLVGASAVRGRSCTCSASLLGT